MGSYKYKLALGYSLLIGSAVLGQSAFQRAPINPDFIRAREQMLPLGIGMERLTAPPVISDKEKKGYIPLSINTDDLPLVYDLRTLGRMTSVKLQTTGGCWAFTTMGSIESTWLTLNAGTYDLGDRNLQICHGYDPSRNTWGNHFISTAYLVRRSGPILQTQDTSLNCTWGITPVAFVSESRYPPQDINLIKQLIMDQGAVYSMIYYSNTYYNPVNKTYFYNGPPNVNHAVDLAGWNDTLVTAGGTGAWICKNSYGSTWGDSGYFYVSYNDASLLIYNSFWPQRLELDTHSTLHHFDELGWVEDYGYEDTLCMDYGLMRISTVENQMITKVGSHINTGGGTVKFWIYDHFDTQTNTLSGLLKETPEFLCPYQGHYMFDLDSAITLAASNEVFLKVRYYTPEYPWPVPVEDTLWYQVGNTWYHDYSNPMIETNRYWISDTGDDGTWFQLGVWPYAMDLCMKAYGERLDTQLAIKLLPEGLYDSNTQHLRKTNNQFGNQFPGAVSDVVAIELREAQFPFDILANYPEVELDTLGFCHLQVPGNLSENYFIAIKHRNSIETWSSMPVSFAVTEDILYDFTESSNSAYGNNLKNMGNKFLIFSGDINQDGLLDSSDMILLDNDAMNFLTGYLLTDLNGDGLIDSSDMILVDNNASVFISRIIPE